jgi:hypothetical protein
MVLPIVLSRYGDETKRRNDCPADTSCPAAIIVLLLCLSFKQLLLILGFLFRSDIVVLIRRTIAISQTLILANVGEPSLPILFSKPAWMLA